MSGWVWYSVVLLRMLMARLLRRVSVSAIKYYYYME